MIAALIYLVLLAVVLVFFASVKKMNDAWKRAFDEMHDDRCFDEYWRHAA
jgi:hypothetical protein